VHSLPVSQHESRASSSLSPFWLIGLFRPRIATGYELPFRYTQCSNPIFRETHLSSNSYLELHTKTTTRTQHLLMAQQSMLLVRCLRVHLVTKPELVMFSLIPFYTDVSSNLVSKGGSISKRQQT
jgi:hypothetical protein